MKYQPPYGITDPNAGYINGNPAAGIQGSIPPAASIEFPMREITTAISMNGIAPDDGDLGQLGRAIRSQAANYLIDQGTQNALVVSPSVALGAYTNGLPLRVKVLHSNISDATHTTLTLDAGSGPASIVMPDGTLPPSNALVSGGIATFAFDGVRWQMQSGGGVGGSGTNTQTITKIPYCDDSGTVSNAIVALYAPPITAIGEGDFLSVKLAHPLVTGPATIAVNALIPPKRVTHVDGTDPITGDAAAGQILLMCFDGTAFQIVSVTGSPPLADSPIRSVFAQVDNQIPTGEVITFFSGWGVQHNTFPAGNPLDLNFFTAPTTGVYLVIFHEFFDIPSGAWLFMYLYDAGNNQLSTLANSGMNVGSSVPLQANAQCHLGVYMTAGQKLRFAAAHSSTRGNETMRGILWIGKVS
jgi:hypothetical protein